MISQYPLLSAILLLMVGSDIAVSGFSGLFFSIERALILHTKYYLYRASIPFIILMIGVMVWIWGLNVLDGQMLALHSTHGLKLFLSVVLFSMGVPLLLNLKFDPLFQQRTSSAYYVWEALHPTAFSTFGFALIIISALMVSP